MPPRKASAEGKPRKPRRKKVEPLTRGLDALSMSEAPEEGRRLAEQIRSDGGSPLAAYREPLGGHAVVLASLPLEKVGPTPYQRDQSEAHVKRLADAIERVDRYLDPVIAVRHDGGYWSPNGNHRIGALKLLGAKAITALVLPEQDVAFQILALNTEKAHNLRERSLEVIRMYRGLLGAGGGKETDYAHLFEEPQLITLGAAYEKRPRYSAGAYHPIVKRLEEFFDLPLEKAIRLREERADKLLALDDAVVQVVEKLKARGLVSPYLKNYVVARVNFLRFKKEGSFEFDSTIAKMAAAARKIDPERVNREDLARMGGIAADIEE
ncbi:MAG: ParB N-terminal domain-containing protein [Myxococcales bacterium]|nr:ParB N-terminal domain-containing protein [Myxococcales bacterium]